MRQLVVTVPVAREKDVLVCLQDVCRLKNVTRQTDGITSSLTCYIAAMESGVILHELDKVGCGAAYGKVAMLAVHLLKPLPNMRDRHLTELVKERTTWRLQGRMATEEIYTNVASGTDLSFDYVAFTVVAAVIAGIGLATNNTVMIVASMLVSPLMGPILAISFGTSVKDWYLLSQGQVAEVVGVAVTFMTGLVIGFICCAWTAPSNDYEWPTAEMASRGSVSNLLVGFFFAVPSGAGVALSTTQGGANALVGVAIAASLLPPVTNTGICMAYAMAGAFRTGRSAGDFAYMGGISFCLFLINVVSIYLVCIFLFWVKACASSLSATRTCLPLTPRGRDRLHRAAGGAYQGQRPPATPAHN